MTEKDYYKILEVSKNASQEDIKKAFKQLARKYHPDINPGNKEAEEKFKEINEAFQVLGNPQKKAQYDQYGESAFSAEDLRNFRNQKFNFDDLFNNFGLGDIFNIFNHDREEEYENYEQEDDLRYDLEITLEEAFNGIKKTIEIPVREICKKCNGLGANKEDLKECPKCHGVGKIKIVKKQGFMQFTSISTCDKCGGTGKIATKYCDTCKGKGFIEKTQKIEIKIPNGINDGQYLRIKREENFGKNILAGDLYVVIHIKEHPVFKREEENLFLDKKIDLTTAIFGGKIEIQGINKKIKLKIPPATQSHTLFKLSGQGMPILNSKNKGDLFVRIIVDIPQLSKNKEKQFKKFIE